MKEVGPLPTVTNSDMEAAIHSPQSNSASGPSSTSNDPLTPHSSTRRKSGTSKGTSGATPQTTRPKNHAYKKNSKVNKDKYASTYPNLRTTTLPVEPSTTSQEWTGGRPNFSQTLLKEAVIQLRVRAKIQEEPTRGPRRVEY